MNQMIHFPYEIREAKPDEWETAMAVAWRTFKKFEACEYSESGIKNFYDFISDNALYKMFLIKEYYLIVALDQGEIIGLISARSQRHISLLFVEEKYHKRGVGRQLMHQMWKHLKENGETFCTVNSSPYAVGFYHKLGFRDTNTEREDDGIRFTPMKKELS